MEKTSCPETIALSSFFDNECEKGEYEEIRIHIQDCAICADQIKRFQAADGYLKTHAVNLMVLTEGPRKEDCLTPEVMTSFFHDILSPDDKRRVEEHLDGCDICLTEFCLLAKSMRQLEQFKKQPLPNDLRERVEGLWRTSAAEKDHLVRLVVRLAKDGLEIVRDALFPPTLVLQEVFAPAGSYRSAEKSSLPHSVFLKQSLAGIQFFVTVHWEAENRAGLLIKIEDEKLAPVSGQRVSLRRDETLVCSERTGADGTVIISDLGSGTYRLGTLISNKEFSIDVEIKNS
jgi:hypothetical protein